MLPGAREIKSLFGKYVKNKQNASIIEYVVFVILGFEQIAISSNCWSNNANIQIATN